MKINLKLRSVEIEKLVKQVVVLVDTREQQNSHILKFFDKKKIPYRTKTLKQGDYSAELKANEELGLPFDVSLESRIIIERKGSSGNGLNELSGNFTKGRTEFENEWIRIKETGADSYLIVENGSWQDIKEHKYDTLLGENAFYNTLISWRKKYGFQIDFVKSDNVAEHIYKLIGTTLKKILEE